MSLFKPKLNVEAAMRMMLGAALRRDPASSLAEVAQSSTLTPVDVAALVRELPTFELAIWHLLFLQLAAKLGAEELTKRFTISLALACRDTGKDPEQGPFELEALMSSVLAYMEAAAERESERYKDAGPGFLYCQEFTSRVLANVDLRHETARNRHIHVFAIAEDGLRTVEAVLSALQREYKIAIQ